MVWGVASVGLSRCACPGGPGNLRRDDVDLVATLVDTWVLRTISPNRVLRTYAAVPRTAPGPSIALLHAHRYEVRKIAALGLWYLVQFGATRAIGGR